MSKQRSTRAVTTLGQHPPTALKALPRQQRILRAAQENGAAWRQKRARIVDGDVLNAVCGAELPANDVAGRQQIAHVTAQGDTLAADCRRTVVGGGDIEVEPIVGQDADGQAGLTRLASGAQVGIDGADGRVLGQQPEVAFQIDGAERLAPGRPQAVFDIICIEPPGTPACPGHFNGPPAGRGGDQVAVNDAQLQPVWRVRRTHHQTRVDEAGA
ncbi:MAG: hypothetical protein ACK56I_06510, partial [bacterium]